MKLIHIETGEEVQLGNAVVNFRNEPGTVSGWSQPRHSNSEGHIEVDGHLVYASVYNCKWADCPSVPFKVITETPGALSNFV